MGNALALPVLRLVQRFSMVVTLGCCIYLIIFLVFKTHDNAPTAGSNALNLKDPDAASSAPVLNIKPYDASVSSQARDIFSLNDVSPSGAVENTPKGQLPAHFKIVAILIADPSQIVIEDTFAKKTYFIDETHPQNGIKIVNVKNNQMMINYQGQDIPVPITKN